MIKTYTWDEIDCEVREYEPSELDALYKATEEGGWEYQEEPLPNGVQVLKTDRHFALETTAATRLQALEKFMEFDTFMEFASERDLKMVAIILEGRAERIRKELNNREERKAQ